MTRNKKEGLLLNTNFKEHDHHVLPLEVIRQKEKISFLLNCARGTFLCYRGMHQKGEIRMNPGSNVDLISNKQVDKLIDWIGERRM